MTRRRADSVQPQAAADPWWGHPPGATSPDVMCAAEGGCCTPGALCHVARRDGCSRGRLLHSWGAFFGLVQRKRPRPRKEIRLLPYPTTTQPHSRVPYPTGQNGHAFPRNPARQTLATWAYVAATMLCCSTFHARDVKDAAPYKAFARHSRRNDYHPSAVREASPRMSWHKYPLTKLPLPVCWKPYYSVVRLV